MDHLRSLVVGEQRTSAITNVLVWFLFITNILSVSARLGTRYFVSKELDWGDGLLVLALVNTDLLVLTGLELRLNTGLHRRLHWLNASASQLLLPMAWEHRPRP